MQQIALFKPPADGFDFDGFLASARAMRPGHIEPMTAPPLIVIPGVAPRIGEFFIRKYQARASEAGVRAAATQLRKQGVPFHITLLILLGVRERFGHLFKGHA